jgi:hypothetical protein
MTKVIPNNDTTGAEPTAAIEDERDENELLLEKTVDGVKSRNPLLKYLVSVRVMILGLAIGLTLGIFVVIILSAASNISSLLNLKGKVQETTLDLMHTFVEVQLQKTEIFAQSALPAYMNGMIPNGYGKGV